MLNGREWTQGVAGQAVAARESLRRESCGLNESNRGGSRWPIRVIGVIRGWLLISGLERATNGRGFVGQAGRLSYGGFVTAERDGYYLTGPNTAQNAVNRTGLIVCTGVISAGGIVPALRSLAI